MISQRTRAALLALPLLLGGCGMGERGPVYIGIAGPVNLANGRSMRLAAEMARDEINRAGGINGRTIELIIMDDSADAERAIEVAAILRDTNVVAVVGHVNSPATLAAAEIYNDQTRGVVQISPASSSPLVTEAGPWTFRVCPSDLQHGPALAEWAYTRLRGRRAAILYANDDYGRGVLQTFASAFERLGGTIIGRDPYLPGLLQENPALTTPYLERALRNGLDVLVIAGQGGPGQTILQQARQLGYTGPVLGGDGLTQLKDVGSVAEGVFVSSAFLPDRATEPAQRFVREYTERYNGELPDHRGAMTYDAIQLLVRAVREVGTDRRAVRDYLAGVGNGVPAFEGVSGTIAFDENGDTPSKEVAIGVIRAGKLLTAS